MRLFWCDGIWNLSSFQLPKCNIYILDMILYWFCFPQDIQLMHLNVTVQKQNETHFALVTLGVWLELDVRLQWMRSGCPVGACCSLCPGRLVWKHVESIYVHCIFYCPRVHMNLVPHSHPSELQNVAECPEKYYTCSSWGHDDSTWSSRTTQDHVLLISLIPMNQNNSNSINWWQILTNSFSSHPTKMKTVALVFASLLRCMSHTWALPERGFSSGESMFPSYSWVYGWPYQCIRILIQDLSFFQCLNKRKGFIIKADGGSTNANCVISASWVPFKTVTL